MALFEPLILWTLVLGTGIPCEKVMDLGESGKSVFDLVRVKEKYERREK